MNYSELVTAVQDYCENTFLTADMNSMIRTAEQNIYNTVQLASLRKNMTGTLSANNKYLSAPGDFISVYSLAVIKANGEYLYLLNKDVNFIREAYPGPTSTGLPKHYAIFGPTYSDSNELSFILGPTPDAIYSVELHYYYYPESIVTAGSTWLGDNFDSVLLYASLLEAYTYMKGEPDVIAQYEKRDKEALVLAKRLGDGMERSDAYRSGQFRMPNLPQNTGVR